MTIIWVGWSGMGVLMVLLEALKQTPPRRSIPSGISRGAVAGGVLPGRMGEKISVFIIACNEAARIGRTLEAVAWADQIVVVDSGSTDDTVAIAKAAGAEVHHRDWEGYGPQKVFAEELCRNDWVLNVDADEVVTAALAEEIRDAAQRDPAAYRIRILNVYPGEARPRPLANDYNVVRFYHRSLAGYRDHLLFDRVEVRGAEWQLQAPIHHHPLLSLAHFVDKENRYSSYAAATAKPRGRVGLLLRLPFEMPFAFVKFYLARGHVLGGWKGFMFALTAAFARVLRIAKMLERQDGERGIEKNDSAMNLTVDDPGANP
ncbi:MAG: glycosyltransferase family 2 protein [Pseudomonadota bacterium]